MHLKSVTLVKIKKKKSFRSSVQVIIYNINITGEKKKKKKISIIDPTECKTMTDLVLKGGEMIG